jgi:hypothetical protein
VRERGSPRLVSKEEPREFVPARLFLVVPRFSAGREFTLFGIGREEFIKREKARGTSEVGVPFSVFEQALVRIAIHGGHPSRSRNLLPAPGVRLGALAW